MNWRTLSHSYKDIVQYLSKLITIGNLMSGLLTGSGLGILLLFKTNKNIKENMLILSLVYIIGIVIGILVDIVI